MAHLVVLGVDNRDDAERLVDLAGDLAKQQLQQGKAAVFILARSATVDKVIDAIKPCNPTVIQTNLTKDGEEELVQALQS
jgi:uncharacterized membrane protein